MTTLDAIPSFMTPTGDARLAGLGALMRKELTEWRRGRRLWVVMGVTTTFLALTGAASWITEQIRLAVPPDVTPPAAPMSLEALDNVVIAVTTGVPILAAIFAVMSLLVSERESGTLAWTASKPVALGSVWLAKWLVAAVMLGVAAVLVPLGVTATLAALLYGTVPVGALAWVTVGLLMTTSLYAAIGLAAATVVRSQAAVAAVGLSAFLLPSLIGGLVPGLSPLLPTSILTWAIGGGMGEPLGWLTPIAWLVAVTILASVAMWRMGREEL